MFSCMCIYSYVHIWVHLYIDICVKLCNTCRYVCLSISFQRAPQLRSVALSSIPCWKVLMRSLNCTSICGKKKMREKAFVVVLPRKLTCHLKRDHFKRNLDVVFQPSFFRGHVSFRGSTCHVGLRLKDLKGRKLYFTAPLFTIIQLHDFIWCDIIQHHVT